MVCTGEAGELESRVKGLRLGCSERTGRWSMVAFLIDPLPL